MAKQQLVETRQVQVKVLEAAGDGTFRFEAVVSEADYINQNRRMYPERVLRPAFDAVNNEIALHPGAVDHPGPWEPVSIQDLGIAWESFRFEGSQVIGTGRIIPTAKGRDLQAAMEAGVAVGFSTRGMGISEEQQIDGRTVNVLTEYTLVTVDAVVDPSVGHARVRSFTKEEKEKMDEELKQLQEAKTALETQLAEAVSARETAEARVTELEGVVAERDERITTLEGQVADLTAKLDEGKEDALEAKLISLTAEHRFAATIIDRAKKLGVTLENAETVVATLTELVEGVAGAANETPADEGAPRGDVSTNEDTVVESADKDGISEEQMAELRAAGLAF